MDREQVDLILGDMRRFMHELMLLPEVIFDYIALFCERAYHGRFKPGRYMSVSGFIHRLVVTLAWIWETTTAYADWMRVSINDMCFGLEPWQVAAYTFGLTCIILWLHSILRSDQPLFERFKKLIFKNVRRIPWVQREIEKEIAKARVSIEKTIHKDDGDREYYLTLPENGFTTSELMAELKDYSEMGDVDWKHGAVSGAVYSPNDDVLPVLSEAFRRFVLSNPLHPDIFPGVRKMEAEVVRMLCSAYHGDSYSCGTMTNGGTESILLACLAYRNRAYSMGISEPEMLVPISAHAAFDKAGEYFRIQVRHIPLEKDTGRVDLKRLRKAITSNTCMLVGSMPNFPHGIMDNVAEISRLGEKHSIPVHVDACLGGFLVPFMEEAGYPLDLFDFRLPGVTSVSADTHKYGFTPKGSSVVLYRSPEFLHYQYFCQPNWPGGIYATPTLAGSRAGLSVATTWATMMFYGRKGYVKWTRDIISTARYIRDKLRSIDGIQVIGEPLANVVAFTSSAFNVYNFNDKMVARGWNLNALQFPSSIHIAVTGRHTAPGVKERFIKDIEEVTAEMLKIPGKPNEGSAALYGMAQSIPDRSIVADCAFLYFDACYNTSPQKYLKQSD
jgi:sphinganine-1-phosphate aldolase